MAMDVSAAFALPADGGLLVGRVWRPDVDGPATVAIRDGDIIDISRAAPTVSQLCNASDAAKLAREATGERLASLDEILAATPRRARQAGRPYLLAPIDLQAIKAAGVTFAISMLERVIEERARGAPEQATALRAEITGLIGDDLARLKPGSPPAMALKDLLIKKGMWSQYLEVGIGPDAEVFTKAPPMAAVGHLAEVGIHPMSRWNNPEPEVVLVVAASGVIVGAALGNDVNLRDVEGPEGYRLEGRSAMSKISRDPADLVAATIGKYHQYPDGAVLYLGTMFAPVEDRDVKGQGFTHKVGDVVTVASPRLGRLSNTVAHADAAEPWTFGAGALMRNLARRGLI